MITTRSRSCPRSFLFERSMAKDWAEAFYKSARWKKCREAFIIGRMMIDGGMCQRCGRQLGYIVHHKIHLTPQNIDDPSVSLSLDNLEYVCKDCHDEEHLPGHGAKATFCGFDEEGRPVERT